MKLSLLCYSDSLFAKQQQLLVERANSIGAFDNIYIRHREHLVETEFYRTHKKILDNPRGSGFCLWKPLFILSCLSRMDEGDVLLYMDAADYITNTDNMREEILSFMSDKDLCITAGAFPNRQYTKRDCFFYMDADSAEYWDAIQVEAGIMLVKNTEYTKKILLEWLNWCKDERIITDQPNVCGLDNLPEFKDIRYDQSTLSIVAQKNGIVPSDFLRKFLTCNYNN